MPYAPKTFRPSWAAQPTVKKDRPYRDNRYHSQKWRDTSLKFLDRHPLCKHCEERGIITEARVTDHIIPARSKVVDFWNESNYQALCTRCHNKKSAKERWSK